MDFLCDSTLGFHRLHRGVTGVAFVFSLKKFVENPAGLTFILSLPTFCSIITGPCTSFLSDRIWTRFGRRKPFIVTSWIGMGICLVLMPLMLNFWSLVGAFIAYSFFSDLNSPIDPLQQEVVPPSERGRSTGAMQWCWNLANITFYFVALGRFDDVRYIAGFPLSGETVIYWSGALLLSVVLLLIVLGIKEIDQHSPLVGQRLSFRNVFGGILDRELWPVYMLVLGGAVLGAGLGPLSNLLYTDQWAYTKQDMGINMAAGGVINFFIIGLLTLFADRLNRMRAYQILITLSLIVNLSYFCYVTFILPDHRPSLLEIIVFGETGSILGLLTGMVYYPLVYDYVRRNKLGTYVAGANLITKITAFITLNGVGLFIWAYAMFFQPPAGEMTRVVVRDEYGQKMDVLAPLLHQLVSYPENGAAVPASALTVTNWQATGAVNQTGRCWEIRLRDENSEGLATKLQQLLQQESAASRDQEGPGVKPSLDATAAQEISRIDSTLAARALSFQQQIAKVLQGRLIADGEQILGAEMRPALLLEIPTLQRPTSAQIESLVRTLRQQREVIDLRPVKLASGYALSLSVLLDSPADAPRAGPLWIAAAEDAARVNAPGLLARPLHFTSSENRLALTMKLLLVEQPLDNYVSPINRVVNLLLACFGRHPQPDHRLISLEQNLRSTGKASHLHLTADEVKRTLQATVLLSPSLDAPALPQDPITARLRLLLDATAPPPCLAEAHQLYDGLVVSAAAEKLTIARPIVATSYAPMKYNYMSGYLWILCMGLIGIMLTFSFTRLESKGFIRKVGAEEAEAS